MAVVTLWHRCYVVHDCDQFALERIASYFDIAESAPVNDRTPLCGNVLVQITDYARQTAKGMPTFLASDESDTDWLEAELSKLVALGLNIRTCEEYLHQYSYLKQEKVSNSDVSYGKEGNLFLASAESPHAQTTEPRPRFVSEIVVMFALRVESARAREFTNSLARYGIAGHGDQVGKHLAL